MVRVTGSIALLFMVSACGGDGSSNSLNESTGSTADYKGKFNGTIKSGVAYTHTWADDGSPYEGGTFDGTVEGNIDFEADRLELIVKGNAKERVVDEFEISLPNIISGNEFSGGDFLEFNVAGLNRYDKQGDLDTSPEAYQFIYSDGSFSDDKSEISGRVYTPYNDWYDNAENEFDVSGTFVATK